MKYAINTQNEDYIVYDYKELKDTIKNIVFDGTHIDDIYVWELGKPLDIYLEIKLNKRLDKD